METNNTASQPEWMTRVAFERNLTAGSEVRALWTNCHNFYSCPAVVVRVNRSSIRVRLTEDYGFYKAGKEIVVPSLLSRTWSPNNRVAAL